MKKRDELVRDRIWFDSVQQGPTGGKTARAGSLDVEKLDEQSKEQRRMRFCWRDATDGKVFLVAPSFNATPTLCPFNGSFE